MMSSQQRWQMANNNILSTLGICRKAGKCITGVDSVCKRMREKRDVFLVLAADGISENSKKKLSDKAAFYNVPVAYTSFDMIVLGSAVGNDSGSACVGITEKGLADSIKKSLI